MWHEQSLFPIAAMIDCANAMQIIDQIPGLFPNLGEFFLAFVENNHL